MNYVFILIILGLCGGGYYEYTQLQATQQTELAADQQQITDRDAKIDALKTEEKQLTDDKTQLTKSVSDAQTQIADLTKQVQAAQAALVTAKAQTQKVTQAAAAQLVHSPNDLGTISTLGGQTYQTCKLLSVDADGIVVSNSNGITKILFGLLPPDLQKRFGYDPHQAAALTAAQIQYQEEQRKAADQVPSNGSTP
jgi:hypothetical protein